MKMDVILQKIGGKNSHKLELLKGSLSALIVRSLGLLFNFLMMVYIARQAGAVGLGLFTLAYTILQLGTILAKLGLDAGLVKFVAQFRANQTPEFIHSVYSKSIVLVVGTTILLGSLLYGLAPFLVNNLLGQPDLLPYLQYVALSLLPFALVFLTGETLRGLKKIKLAVLLTGTLVFVLAFLAILLLPLPLSPLMAFEYFCYAIGITAVVGLLLVHQAGIRFSWQAFGEQNVPIKRLLAFSLPMFLVISLNIFSKQINTLMLGFLGTISDVGIFDVAMKVAVLTSIPLGAINSIAAPKLSESYAKNDPVGLRQTAIQSSKLTLLASTPILLICLIFPYYILQIFGDEFSNTGVMALRIIVIAQFINAAAGPVAYVLQMTENQNIVGHIMLVSTIIGILINIILIPTLGVDGAAIAYATSLILWNIGCLFFIKKKLGFVAIPFWENGK